MNNILIGSASWTDKTLVECGRFYPKDCKSAEARLRHYATQFPIVEVDSSYYGMPTPANAQLWAERTPEHFTFNIKAFRLFTGHQTSPTVLHKDLQQALGPDAPKVLYYKDTPKEIADELWRRFSEAVEPLRAAATHPDERVRKAVIEALGCFHTQAVIEPLRRALADPAPVARASAAHALSQRHSPGLALPILVALESEKDPLAWEALVVAVARIDSFEAVSGLVEIALDKRPLFQSGRPKAQRMTVVHALRRAGTASARRGRPA